HSPATAGWLVLETTSISYGRASAYLPLIELLKSYFRIDARDDAATVRDKVTAKLSAFEPALESLRPALLALLDAPIADRAWERLDSLQRRQRTIDAVRQLLVREARRQPVLLVVEDLHWIDSETQALLDDLVDGLFGTQLLLLVNYRPEYRHDWGGKV